MAKRDLRSLWADTPRLLVLGFLALLLLMPYIWMISASVKPLDELFGRNAFTVLRITGRFFHRFRYLGTSGTVLLSALEFFFSSCFSLFRQPMRSRNCTSLAEIWSLAWLCWGFLYRPTFQRCHFMWPLAKWGC
jgi:ABC-type glycerol-3-phosphate transport system permease component